VISEQSRQNDWLAKSSIKRSLYRAKEALTLILEGTKPKNTIAVLDGVRALAILTVIFYHLSVKSGVKNIPWLDVHIVALIYMGYGGVTLFFVLSGFLLFLPYIKSLLFDNTWPSVRMFYLRRALRIMPAYYLSLFLLILLAQPLYLQPDHWKELLLFLTFTMDFSQKTFQHLNAPFWSLAVEWQFYMLLPWLALALRFVVQRGSLRQRVWILILCLGGVIAWGITTRYWGNYITEHPNIHLGLPPVVFKVIVAFLYGCGGPGLHGKFLEDFAIGMLISLCYMLTRNIPSEKWNNFLRRLSPVLLAGSLLWLAIMAFWSSELLVPPSKDAFATFFYGDAYTTFHEFGIALGYGGLVLAVLFGGALLKQIFEWSLLRWIGIVSFTMYIWHNPIFLPFADAMAPFVHNWSPFRVFCLNLLWVIIAIPSFSFLGYVLIEKPFMRISDGLRRSQQQKVKEDVPVSQILPSVAPVTQSSQEW
jgi:peptidoglycan/LPS O-acetylase OafA/YrhL